MRNILNDVIYIGYFEAKERYQRALENGDWLMMDMYSALLMNQKEILKEVFADFLDEDYNNTVLMERKGE